LVAIATRARETADPVAFPVAGGSDAASQRASAGADRPVMQKVKRPEPRGRALLVYASTHVLAQARPIVGDGVVIEQFVAAAVQKGLRRSIPGVTIELRQDERLARPLGAPWVAVVARTESRLTGRRRRSCWEIRSVHRLGEEASRD
jgi:hypothetical protein